VYQGRFKGVRRFHPDQSDANPNSYRNGYIYANANGNSYVHAYTNANSYSYRNGYIHTYTWTNSHVYSDGDSHSYGDGNSHGYGNLYADTNTWGEPDTNANGDSDSYDNSGGNRNSNSYCDTNGNTNINADTDGNGYIYANANPDLSTYNLDRVKLQWHTHQRWQLHLVQWRAEAERPRCGPGNDSFHPADNYQRELHAFRAGCECDLWSRGNYRYHDVCWWNVGDTRAVIAPGG
jgi:hypothetical protein